MRTRPWFRLVAAVLVVGGVTAGFLLSEPGPLQVLEGRPACAPVTGSERAYLLRAAADLAEARSRVPQIGFVPLPRNHPMIDGRRLRLAAARRFLPFATVLPHDPLACGVLQGAVWVDPERTELLLDYQTGIVITESRALGSRPDWARVARAVGAVASVGHAQGTSALVIRAGEQVNPASVTLFLHGLLVAVYAKYTPYSTATLIRVADSLH